MARRVKKKPAEPRRHVLLVPVSHYPAGSTFRPLPGVVRDAERLQALLQNIELCNVHGLEVLPSGRATRQGILKAVKRLAAHAGRSDQVILYIGGHAHRAMDDTDTTWKHWFLPYDATAGSIERTGISTDDLAAMLSRFEAREVVVILGFCYAAGVTGFPWPGRLLERLHQRNASHFIVCATLDDEEEPDTEAGGLFVQALCEALEGQYPVPDSAGRISIQQAWCHTAAAVEVDAATGPDRQHAFAAGIGGPIYITHKTSRRTTSIVGIYPHGEHAEVLNRIRSLIPKSRRMLLVGTGLNVAWERQIPKLLLERARQPGVQIDICLANPRNPSVRNRLVEERMWYDDPPLDRNGMERRVRNLVIGNRRQRSRGRMEVRLFEHYPTTATLIFDDDIFVYPYGFHVLGSHSPITHIRDDGSDEALFYRDNARRIFESGIPADAALAAWDNPKFIDPEWITAAVYLIPPSRHKLYRFGSAVLGYDIHTGRRRNAPVGSVVARARACVGEASRYGFHVTLADALYFRPETLERVEAEVRVLATEFKPFRLTGVHTAREFHGDPQMFALRCNDPSGNAEALHHELVARVYSLALSSTYRAGTFVKEPPVHRTRRQFNHIRRFGAPYILGEFDPHFTLCANMPRVEEDRHQLATEIQDALERKVGSRPSFRAEELCLVVRARGDEYWSIRATFPLTG